MIIGVFRDVLGEEHANIYNGYGAWDKYHSDTWNPGTKDILVIDFVIRGKTYSERKACLAEMAKDYQIAYSYGLSPYYSELAEIDDFFITNGERYGLLKEFRANGII